MRHLIKQPSVWLCLVFAFLWISAEVRYRQTKHRLDTLWVKTVTVMAVDDTTGAILPTSVGGATVSGEALPRIVFGVTLAGSAKTNPVSRLTVASDAPVSLAVSSEGYGGEFVSLDSSSASELSVRLKKE